jgi:hypothetical protein
LMGIRVVDSAGFSIELKQDSEVSARARSVLGMLLAILQQVLRVPVPRAEVLGAD